MAFIHIEKNIMFLRPFGVYKNILLEFWNQLNNTKYNHNVYITQNNSSIIYYEIQSLDIFEVSVLLRL